ncbi:hypothetical protein Hanom_Chr00s000059g01618811 [Helianthus anomalus]
MSLPRLEPSTSEKRWVSVANWATLVGLHVCLRHTYIFTYFKFSTFSHNHFKSQELL